jgi:hypothetical protein
MYSHDFKNYRSLIYFAFFDFRVVSERGEWHAGFFLVRHSFRLLPLALSLACIVSVPLQVSSVGDDSLSLMFAQGEVDDLASLEHLNEDILLKELQLRYANNKIYVRPSTFILDIFFFSALYVGVIVDDGLKGALGDPHFFRKLNTVCADVCDGHSRGGQSVQEAPALRRRGLCWDPFDRADGMSAWPPH